MIKRGQDSTTNTAALDTVYATRFSVNSPERLEWRRKLWRILVQDFFSRWIPRDATVIDFGCGLGEFINAVQARRRIGLDLRESVSNNLEPDVEFIHSYGDWSAQFGDGVADVVFCSHLLEHLPDRKTVTLLLREFRRILRPQGRLLVLGPNLRYSGAKYWDFFDHILPFTHFSLVEALATGGFETELLVPRFLPFSTVGVPKAPLLFVRLYLRLPFVWKVLGAQFFAVAKPGSD